MQACLKGFFYTDDQTKEAIRELYNEHGYLTCPHSAIGYLGLKDYFKTTSSQEIGVFLSTAHYSKFLPEMENTLSFVPKIPEKLMGLLTKEKVAVELNNSFEDFKNYLIDNLL